MGTTEGCLWQCGIRGAAPLKPSMDDGVLSWGNTQYCPIKTLGTIGGCLVVAQGVAVLNPFVGIKQVALGQHEGLS